MKPDWEDAPGWANYLAMDYDGEWWWFERKPVMGCNLWKVDCGMSKRHGITGDWRTTLESRPE
jgi:hypothetical protein